jgi:hypothetical protein
VCGRIGGCVAAQRAHAAPSTASVVHPTHPRFVVAKKQVNSCIFACGACAAVRGDTGRDEGPANSPLPPPPRRPTIGTSGFLPSGLVVGAHIVEEGAPRLRDRAACDDVTGRPLTPNISARLEPPVGRPRQ